MMKIESLKQLSAEGMDGQRLPLLELLSEPKTNVAPFFTLGYVFVTWVVRLRKEYGKMENGM